MAICYQHRPIPPGSGVLIETAHAILAGLDPADDMAFALYHDKLWSVHLNDQNGLKYDQDKAFGSVNLRGAFNQVRVLEKDGYGQNGECVGLDVKAMRTQKRDVSLKHLANSKENFQILLEKVRTLDRKIEDQLHRGAGLRGARRLHHPSPHRRGGREAEVGKSRGRERES